MVFTEEDKHAITFLRKNKNCGAKRFLKEFYRDVLLKQDLLPDIRDITDEYFIFQQDSAPAHRARYTVALLETETPDFIPPTLWPPNIPDLNPVDYTMWSVMQEKVNRSRICDVSELLSRIVEAWDEMDQRIIDESVKQWRTRLRACVAAKGGGVNFNINFNFPNV